MKSCVKKAIPLSLGASLAACFLELFRYPGIWGVGAFSFNFVLTFVVTTVVVAACLWLWSLVIKNRPSK